MRSDLEVSVDAPTGSGPVTIDIHQAESSTAPEGGGRIHGRGDVVDPRRPRHRESSSASSSSSCKITITITNHHYAVDDAEDDDGADDDGAESDPVADGTSGHTGGVVVDCERSSNGRTPTTQTTHGSWNDDEEEEENIRGKPHVKTD